MIETKESLSASKATIGRLPLYLRYLREKSNKGEVNISSTAIADDMRLNAVQVRKDLAFVSSVSGKPKVGFDISELIESIEKFLGCDNVNDALIVGAGGLGSTLLAYEGFKNYGLNIMAAFDNNPIIVGTKINGITVLPTDKIMSTAKRMNIQVGIITVPKQFAQEVAEQLVQSGIRAIWNFAPKQLRLPPEIAVKNEDLAASLALLTQKLQNRQKI